MRSKEAADFTGVTVRALRHYHALGILPEPARDDNGYREYSVKDAVTALRIDSPRQTLRASARTVRAYAETASSPTG